jgi:ectoine hydroxylase-related dioxygenase (phytanoyl-CoA dioxygenase family)
MKPFRTIDARDLDSADLKGEMEVRGYVLIRRLLSPNDLTPLLREVSEILRNAGWIDSDTDPLDRAANAGAACADGDSLYKNTYDQVFGLQSFHAMPHHPALQRVMKLLVGPQLLIHPKSAARLIFPNFERGIIHAHQDHTAVAGDAVSFTAWMPLHDCPPEQGPLKILEGSHRFGLQPTAGQTGYIEHGTEQGDGWVGGEINAGDVLLFHSLTVHEAGANRSSQLRISLDCRFQSYERAVNPGALVFAGSGRRSWEKTYTNWRSDELKYYWTRLPLNLEPSRPELRALAQTSESPEMRSRYTRILERIEAQMPVGATHAATDIPSLEFD